MGERETTQERIMAATLDVLGRAGEDKLSLSDVAQAAGVSRPTLYRHFASKSGLLEAFGRHEQARFDRGIAEATSGLRGNERLEAVLAFVVEFQHSYSLRRMVDIEPRQVLHQMRFVLPVIEGRLEPYFTGRDGPTIAAVVARVAMSHYLLPEDDPDRFLRELRTAARLPPGALLRRQSSMAK